MGKRNEVKSAAPEPQQVETVVEETKVPKYVVIRDGYRVSDKEYETSDDSMCVAEVDFWTKVSMNHSCGEKVEAVVYDPKKHRVW